MKQRIAYPQATDEGPALGEALPDKTPPPDEKASQTERAHAESNQVAWHHLGGGDLAKPETLPAAFAGAKTLSLNSSISEDVANERDLK